MSAACTRLEDGRECGDEGDLCDACLERAAKDYGYLRRAPKYAVMFDDDAYYAELRDAGRMPR